MARTSRLIIENVCYHTITRGNQRQSVFREDADFSRYLDLLKRYKRKYQAKLYGYCLMTNHVHIMIDSINLTRFMHSINLAYTSYFNGKYRKVGHLWQGRFKSMVVKKDRYLIDCVSYIENNPVRAKMVNSPIDYPWSSFKVRVIGHKDSILDPIEVL